MAETNPVIEMEIQNSQPVIGMDLAQSSAAARAVIDDNAGAGVTDKTWSANKLTAEDAVLRRTIITDYSKITAVPENADLNDYRTPGNYAVTYGSVAETLSNAPTGSAGQLCVFQINTAVYVQIYLAYDGNLYIRSYYSRAWHDWETNTNSTILQGVTDQLEKMLVLDEAQRTAIPANADLNDYTTSGNYDIASVVTASTISNLPQVVLGALTVFTQKYGANATMIVQAYRTADRTFFRTKQGNADWSRWILSEIEHSYCQNPDDKFFKITNSFENRIYSSTNKTYDASQNRASMMIRVNDGSVVIYDPSKYDATYTVINPSDLTALIPNKGWDTSGRMVIDTEGLVDYTVVISLANAGSRNTKIMPVVADADVLVLNRKKEVDLFLFIGQSNMAGRGATSETWPESYPSLIPCAGLEFRAVTDPTRLYPISEPFGLAQNKTGAIDDGNRKTGGMVVAFTNAYFEKTGMQIVGVSASEGGTSIDQWAHGSARLEDAIDRFGDAVTYLNVNGYTVRHKFMVWCQGESDTRAGITAQQHKEYFDGIQTDLLAAGIEKCFMCRIGEYNGTGYDYTPIISVQTQIAQEDPDVVMATTALASFKDRDLMKDEYHFYQAGYNEMGRYAGINAAEYVNTGKEPTMYDPKNGNLYYSHKN